MTELNADELIKLIQGVFPPLPGDRYLGILVDVPRSSAKDNPEWKERRAIAETWYRHLKNRFADLKLHGIRLIAYPDVGSNNAELPDTATCLEERLPPEASGLSRSGVEWKFEEIFKKTQLFLAPTEYSTTAPLKNAARLFGFRAATMPGFSPAMIPALKIDYNSVNLRVKRIKERLDSAKSADVLFLLDGKEEYRMVFDLRFREGHASSGRFPEAGTAGNLPSGEAYIVPYEGEKGEPSRTAGILPVQMDDELVLFTVRENRAVSVTGDGNRVERERRHLEREPAYGNMAELGFGVLEGFGLQPSGSILLDEKLGFHIAFGRSEHFGGITGPEKFSSPEEVIHLDRIYIPATQPRIEIAELSLVDEIGKHLLIKDGKYRPF